MKRVFVLFFIFLINQHLYSQGNEEFRATWIVDYQWLSPDKNVEENKAVTRLILDNHKKANMNAVLWQIRRFGTVYFNSSIESWGPQAGFQDPGYDPLDYAIQEAHARGLEFHAWFNVFESRHAYPGSPSQQHPEWICRDRDGNPMPSEIAWLSPGLEEVRQYLIDVALELVKNYDIDGLHLDFIRWNEHTNSSQSLRLAKMALQQQLPDGIITEAQLNDLIINASGRYLYDVEHPFSGGIPQGFATWEDWWRWTVTEFVQVLHDSIQAVKPWVRLSPAALGRYNWGGWQGFDIVYQDAALWFNEGYIDQLIGMHYHWFTGQEFYSVLTGGCPQCWSQFIQPGIQAGRLYTVGPFSDKMFEDRIWGRHLEIVDRSRDVFWVDGFQFFSYGSWQDQNYWKEARDVLFERKTKIRATKLIVDTTPDAPNINLTKLDSLHYEIAVAPPASVLENHRFAIYRSPDESLDKDNDEIIDIHFGNTGYSYIDSFTGTQDYNGTYYYFVTTLDRYWNESNISNFMQSDSIPSFAPAVIASTPAEGDTIPVNSDIEITFSKTMDVGSFQNAVSFSPTMNINQLIWSNDHKTLTITIAGAFEFATDYTLTIEPTVTDINGKQLDGNGDGIGGDAFNLAFRTLAQDVVGPQIVYSFPHFQIPEVHFAIDEVITFLFDEIVDKNTVTDTGILLKQQQNEIPIGILVTNVDEKSVLSIQPLQPLENDTEYAITLSREIADTLGNQMDSDITVTFRTSSERYIENILIDPFFSTSNWWQPSQSGSTMGIIKANTSFEMSTEAYLPSSPVRQRISPSLRYAWDATASEFLIRIYLSGGPPRAVFFDTTYVLQCYVFGDGSNNKFRFAVDDSTKDQAAFHEVSKWITLDWYGWRIVEWHLNDPNSVGEWIGDGVLNGPSLRFDSFHLTHEPGTSSVKGKIFFDNLRLVKKTSAPVHVAELSNRMPTSFSLYQNYPNPFNPTTTIAFDISEDGVAKLTVYDMLGREVKTLLWERLKAGHYKVQFDASGLASGVYFYRLTFNNRQRSKSMILMK